MVLDRLFYNSKNHLALSIPGPLGINVCAPEGVL